MNLKDIYEIKDGKIVLKRYNAVIRDYLNFAQTEYRETRMYLNDDEMREWEEQLIPKHKRYELIEKNENDLTGYEWMIGITPRTENPEAEVLAMAQYASREEYEASLPENQAEYQLDLDYRLSKIELGI